MKRNALHTVFVYGTLRHGGGNAHLLRDADYICSGRTVDPFVMVELYGGAFPGLVDLDDWQGDDNAATQIVGELYLVNDDQLARLDRLESVPTMYQRETVHVAHDDDDGATIASVYLYQHANDAGPERVVQSGDWFDFATPTPW